ncbi:hypothetical protein H4P12_12275 [Paracoccus sp. 11-3]|uniref:SH3 domain-containing protein n=1 Tax=Paracoccus amoyensis TaxID=2760093 RepID=A0A926GE38_9RHOB|nr:hypothetical protein [Paracoccus amoyensis]MBC9247470.1 hypothetical protein [Paracoccus amoyensis]
MQIMIFKRALPLLAALAITTPAAAEAASCLRIVNVSAGDALNLRQGPSTRSAILARIVPHDTGQLVLDAPCTPMSVPWAERWCPVTYTPSYQVNLASPRGYVKARFIRDAPCATTQNEVRPVTPTTPVPVLSPVPNVSAWGQDWTLSVGAVNRREHIARMTIPGSRGEWLGTLNYNGVPADAPSNIFMLSGEVRNGIAMIPLSVHITPRSCTANGRRGSYEVTIYPTNGDKLTGCADPASR